MKKKILFYGNCQLAVISQYFLKNPALNELFEVIKCDESCAPMDIWRGDQSNFAAWTKENRIIQNQIYKIIHEKLRQADIFIFQSTTHKACIEELNTKYLCENISKGQNICVPNMRLFLYCNDISTLTPYLEYAQLNVKNPNNPKELAEFLRYSNDSKFRNILEREYPISTIYQKGRNENSQRAKEDLINYKNNISMEKFIKDNYKKNLLAIRHNHMNIIYFIELLKRIFALLDIENVEIKKQEIKYPGVNPADSIDPFQFKFFINYFTELTNTYANINRYPFEYIIEKHFLKN
jgi:hypothetical protein